MTNGRACLNCGQPLPANRRADARYCNASCQREAHRQRAGFSGPGTPPAFDWSALHERGPIAQQRGRKRYARNRGQAT
jgi:RNA polymerase-binding transcription factor DksA